MAQDVLAGRHALVTGGAGLDILVKDAGIELSGLIVDAEADDLCRVRGQRPRQADLDPSDPRWGQILKGNVKRATGAGRRCVARPGSPAPG
ncbi:hypothetical protein DVA67_025745 [Solirubrobacter sp. CPCC 204708]|uniref:Uncharacterized protein n=1 Tax=Solirubrobacter deserti TaxID=2282478 RepID=A0ABT4RFL1_9ACTN|nr:hypothetical protein [Solirubrobacter deserti]MBE2319404.1 hypothetical protein [Solirubrobacter deserti]MDA0137312.1 hypothetical protein [Solirubrobacter deserti]